MIMFSGILVNVNKNIKFCRVNLKMLKIVFLSLNYIALFDNQTKRSLYDKETKIINTKLLFQIKQIWVLLLKIKIALMYVRNLKLENQDYLIPYDRNCREFQCMH